jgi:ERCC4-type nuclease
MAKKKAKNAANQAALDRLHELKEKSVNTKYVHTVSRAISSLATCPNAITTRKAAVEQLKYVGPHMAKVILPHHEAPTRTVSRGSSVDSSTDTRKQTKKKRKLPTTVTANASKEIAASAKQVAYEKAVEHATALKLPSGPWKVILLLDGREHNAEHVQAKLQMSGIPCEQRHLPIGDMAWLARCGDVEIMLGTICERKQVNDLASSLFGTRYAEQRLRLQHCGLPQLLLLVEGNTSTVHNCPGDTLETAMMETRVQLNFQVIQTKHLDDTVRFLKNVHRRILQRAFPSAFGNDLPTAIPSFSSPHRKRRRRNQKISLVDIVFDEPPVPPLGMSRFVTYTQLKTRVERDREAGTRTVGAIHAAMLKQIPTLSLKKVHAIQQAYPTPKALFGTYIGLSPEDGKTLVQDFLSNTGMERTCRVGPKSAEEVYHAYTQVLEEKENGASEGVARMPSRLEATVPDNDKNDEAGSPVSQGNSSSPEWSSQSDSKPAARDDTTIFTSPPFPAVDIEMQLAIEGRRLQYQESQKQPAAILDKNLMDESVVDLTQGGESDTENNNNNNNVGFSQQSTDDVGLPSSQASFSENSPPVCANAATFSQESKSSMGDDGDEEPLYERLQRLHQARQAVESRKKRQSPNNKTSIKRNDVIEIE